MLLENHFYIHNFQKRVIKLFIIIITTFIAYITFIHMVYITNYKTIRHSYSFYLLLIITFLEL